MPVAIHISRPRSLLLPIDRFNERWKNNTRIQLVFSWKRLSRHRELQGARKRHAAPSRVLSSSASRCGCRRPPLRFRVPGQPHPNMHVISRLGSASWGVNRACPAVFRQVPGPDVFGTTPALVRARRNRVSATALYEIYYVFSKRGRVFRLRPARIPPQGRWRIYGVGLSEQVLRKVYRDNAARLLGYPRGVKLALRGPQDACLTSW